MFSRFYPNLDISCVQNYINHMSVLHSLQKIHVSYSYYIKVIIRHLGLFLEAWKGGRWQKYPEFSPANKQKQNLFSNLSIIKIAMQGKEAEKFCFEKTWGAPCQLPSLCYMSDYSYLNLRPELHWHCLLSAE